MKYVTISRENKLYSRPLHKLEIEVKDLKIAHKTEDGNIRLSKSPTYKSCILKEHATEQNPEICLSAFFPTFTNEYFILSSIWADGLKAIVVDGDNVITFIASNENKPEIRQVKAGALFQEEYKDLDCEIRTWSYFDYEPFGFIVFGKEFCKDFVTKSTLIQKDGAWCLRSGDGTDIRKIELEE